MKLTILPLALLLTSVIAIPNPDPEAEPEALAEALAGADLEKRACTKLSHKQCHAAPKTKSGVYCGWCGPVLGEHYKSHLNWAYQLNGKTKECCTYGYRKSCDKAGKQCPIPGA